MAEAVRDGSHHFMRVTKMVGRVWGKMGLALAFVLAGSAVWAEPTDYVLVLPTGERVCAKSAETCVAARRAIERGWWPILPSGSGIRCEPHPGCFDPASNVIPGFNDR